MKLHECKCNTGEPGIIINATGYFYAEKCGACTGLFWKQYTTMYTPCELNNTIQYQPEIIPFHYYEH